MKEEHVHVVVLKIFQMKKVDLVVLFILIALQCTQCVRVPNSSLSSSDKVSEQKPQTCVKDGQDSEAISLESECRSVFAYGSAKNIME